MSEETVLVIGNVKNAAESILGDFAMFDWITEIEQRAKSATHGPWELITDNVIAVISQTKPFKTTICTHAHHGESVTIPNAAFIAHSREDIERLTKALRTAEHSLNQIRSGGGYLDHFKTNYSTWERQHMMGEAKEALEQIETMK